MRQSIVRVGAVAQPLPDTLHTTGVSLTRRSDGSYTLAISGRGRVDPTPQLLRFAPQFLPMFAKRWRNVFPGNLEGMRSGHETLARWRLDAPTPMEQVRVLNPRPDPGAVRQTYDRAVALLPALAAGGIAGTWAGYVDSTPDGVPAIGETPEVPGLVLAAGFSGHGFGIGPGAGHLIADLVTGAPPIFDPGAVPAGALPPVGLGQGGGVLTRAVLQAATRPPASRPARSSRMAWAAWPAPSMPSYSPRTPLRLLAEAAGGQQALHRRRHRRAARHGAAPPPAPCPGAPPGPH